jgi:spore germination protein GerM
MKMKKIALVFLVLAFAAVAVSAQKEQTMTIKVFFGNEKSNPNMQDCGKVEATTRAIPKTKASARAALEELFKGVTPEEEAKGFTSLPAAETKGILKSIRIKNGAAYVNFNPVVYRQTGTATTSCGGSYFFSSVEKTLQQFTTIKKVFYAIDGSPKDFYDWVQVGECPKELKNCSNKNF